MVQWEGDRSAGLYNLLAMKKCLLLVVSCLLLGINSTNAQFSDHRKTLLDSEFVVGDVIKIPAVLYDLNKATLRPESMDSLKLVVDFLQLYPYLAVEISTHLDSRSSPSSSSNLSFSRAKMCLDSLVKLGITPER